MMMMVIMMIVESHDLQEEGVARFEARVLTLNVPRRTVESDMYIYRDRALPQLIVRRRNAKPRKMTTTTTGERERSIGDRSWLGR